MSSLGLYVHVPFCKHACPYCDFYKLELRDRPARARLDFPGQLRRELGLLAAAEPGLCDQRLATVYLGGGTPSTLVPASVAEMLTEWRTLFPTAPDAEFTLEANPENLTESRARQWHSAGFTRLSIGLQSFNPAELKLLERLHEPATITEAMGRAREAGFQNISLDLMFALPGQTLNGWMDNLRRAVELEPEHLSFYGLTWHEGTPFTAALEQGRLHELEEDVQAEMYLRGAAFLEEAGFEHYEISNFARPGFRSRHNARYWSGQDVVGLGPGAHSRLGTRRWSNPENLDAWATAVEAARPPRTGIESPTAGEQAWEALFTGLRRVEGIERATNPELHTACLHWARDNAPDAARWMESTPERARLTREGWLVSDAILGALIRYAIAPGSSLP